MQNKLEGRVTQLHFDKYTSKQLTLLTGINQRCPLSLLTCSYYNSDLIETVTTSRKEQKIAYHDDMGLLARGKNFKEASRTIVDMMIRENST